MPWPVLCAFAAEPIYSLPRVNLGWILPVLGFNSSSISSCGRCHIPCLPITREAAATRTKVLCADSSAGRCTSGLLCLILSQNHLILRGDNFLSWDLDLHLLPSDPKEPYESRWCLHWLQSFYRVTLFHSVACALWYGQSKTDVSQLKAVILVTALAETHLL